MALPLVAIIGRPNVGKSTLFNRALGKRVAITHDEPGVTRDRIYGRAEWSGKEYLLIDTGGYIPESDDLIQVMVREQADAAIEEADAIVFVTDAQVGPADLDQRIAERLLKGGKPVLLVANKADNPDLVLDSAAFFKLGLGEPLPVSASNGLKFADFLDRLAAHLPQKTGLPEADLLKIAILGRPNVGKSSLVNFLAGKERQIVTDIPGTTRDAIDLRVRHGGKEYLLIDTAGLRRKSRIKENLEYFTTLRTIRALERCDVAALLLEAPEGLVNQDIQIINEIEAFRKGVVICVNKWDLVEKDDKSVARFQEAFQTKLPTKRYIPLVFISALTGQRAVALLARLEEVNEQQNLKIRTAALNACLRAAVEQQPPAAVQGKYIRLLYMTQVDVRPPSFVIFSNYPQLLKKEYLRYLENRLREQFGFSGVPIRIRIKPR